MKALVQWAVKITQVLGIWRGDVSHLAGQGAIRSFRYASYGVTPEFALWCLVPLSRSNVDDRSFSDTNIDTHTCLVRPRLCTTRLYIWYREVQSVF